MKLKSDKIGINDLELIDNPKAIVTHYAPDIDACASVWVVRRLYSKNIPVEFAPTGLAKEKCDPEKLYADMSCGIKEGNGYCASKYLSLFLPEKEQELLTELFYYVDLVDKGGLRHEEDYQHVHPFDSIVAGLNMTGDNQTTVDVMCKIFDGLLAKANSIYEAQELFDNHTKVVNTIAIVDYPDEITKLNFAVERIIKDHYVVDVIISKVGNNVGAKRVNEGIDFKEYVDEFPKWFIHPAGFMMQWGSLSEKGDKASAPPKESVSTIINKLCGFSKAALRFKCPDCGLESVNNIHDCPICGYEG